MAEFIHSVHQRRISMTSGTELVTPMPVLPLSHVLITIDAVKTSANTNDTYVGLFDCLGSIQFRFYGTLIWNLRGTDLYRMARALGIYAARVQAQGQGASARRIFTLMIPFGRSIFNPAECFPAVPKGATELGLTFTNASGYTTPVVTVESVQLVDGNPKNFLRCTTFSSTPAATGDVDFDIPRNSQIMGIGATVTASEPGSTTGTVETLKILANNVETDYSLITEYGARAAQWYRDTPGLEAEAFVHIENTAGAYAQNATTLTEFMSVDPTSEFMWLDFDPRRDGNYLLNANSFQDLKMRMNFNTAAAVRFMPVEWWSPAMISRQIQQAGGAGGAAGR